ncbi:retrograde transport protein Dsl1 C terminal-domain-containing protein [Scheffersomyces xylosifermentans]|uniref:retrograde transport protein Dsl1 C terminal-domain-containing protein n=1 Tax=Scheffersomyces xylosifermentans TaxID=1304137 RepID=UPI00315CAE5E
MSIERLLSDSELRLGEIQQKLISATQDVTESSLSREPYFVQQFYEDTSPKEIDDINKDIVQNDLSTLGVTQLNHRYEQVSNDIVELNKLAHIQNYLVEIEDLLAKPKSISSLLDFQQLFSLFKSTRNETTKGTTSQFIIYKHISKAIDNAFARFVDQLEDNLKLLIPNEYTIENVSILHEFNALLHKNSLKLEYYSKLRLKWDRLVDKILSPGENNYRLHLLDEKLNDYGSVAIDLISDESNASGFILSVRNLLEFINYLQLDTLKHYLNSKISRLLIHKISTNIDIIINNDNSKEDLKKLIEYSNSTSWNVLAGLHSTDTKSIEEKLNSIYLEWKVDNYIDKIRASFNSGSIDKITEWDEIPEVKSEKATATQELGQTPSEEADAWNDGWDEAWDDDVIEEDQKSTEAKNDNNGPKIKVSDLSKELASIVHNFQEHSPDISYLIGSIKALSLAKYPPLSRSFLIYNDMKKISVSLHSPELLTFVDVNWNQYLIRFFEQIKGILNSLNLTDSISNDSPEPEDEYSDLDDYNLNQLSLIYSWFDMLVQETELQNTNEAKFKELINALVSFINEWLIAKIISFSEISEDRSIKIVKIIDSLNNVTVPYVMLIGESKEDIKSYNKLNNLKFLLKNHLKDIMDRFYEGDLFDIETEELIKIIRSVFIQSELRDNYITEILEFRNMN